MSRSSEYPAQWAVTAKRRGQPTLHTRNPASLTARAILFVFLAGYLSLAQPGICPCWLLKDVHDLHPHPAGHPELPHTHDYLFGMFASAPALATNIPVETPSVLLALTSLQGLWRSPVDANLGEQASGRPPPTPPPQRLPA